MFTAQGNRLNSHYNDDLRFCRVEGVVNHYQRLKDEEQLQQVYAARDAAVGVDRIAIEAAIPVLQNYMMQRSTAIIRHTTVISQLIELSHDDIFGNYYFTGNRIAKSPQLPSDAHWFGGHFNLGHISSKLNGIIIWYKNTDEELFYKQFGFAYLVSNYKEQLLNNYGYRNEIFEYHYETEVFKKLRANWNLSFLQQPLNTHYRLIKEAYDSRHLIAPSNYESNNTLLFDGQNVVVYPGQHLWATCAQYFDLSRVDPDARGITIYFFPGHEKTLYQEHGFAYIVSGAANNTPGGSRADLIKKFHNPIFVTYYGHLPGRTYDIVYPQKWRLEMNQVEYDWSIEKARLDAKNKKNMAIVKGIIGMGFGAFASTLVPGLGSQLLTAILRGATFSGVSSAVQGGNIAKGTFQGALFAGLNHTLSSMSVLKDAKKLQDALRIGVTAAISAEMNGENVFKSMLIAVGTDALVGQFMKSEGLTQQEALIRAFGKSAVANVLGGQNLGNALMAGFIGGMGELAQKTGEGLGNGIKETAEEVKIQKKVEKIREKEKQVYGKPITTAYDKVNKEWWSDGKNVSEYSKKLNIEFEQFKPPTKKEDPSWWAMFKRTFNGDTSPDVLEWKQNLLNQKHMQYIKAVCDGARQGTEIGAPIREVGLTIIGGGIGAVGMNTVVKGSGKLLFSYKMYQKVEQASRPKITGGRTVKEELAKEKAAAKLYDEIRISSDDVQNISNNLNLPEFQVQRVKDHLFYKEHQLGHDLGIGRFHPDIDIANAWKRLEAGIYNEADLKIFKHEHFESRFEGIFRTDYNTAHNAAIKAGHPSGLENNTLIQEVTNGFTNRY